MIYFRARPRHVMCSIFYIIISNLKIEELCRAGAASYQPNTACFLVWKRGPRSYRSVELTPEYGSSGTTQIEVAKNSSANERQRKTISSTASPLSCFIPILGTSMAHRSTCPSCSDILFECNLKNNMQIRNKHSEPRSTAGVASRHLTQHLIRSRVHNPLGTRMLKAVRLE